jgi:hypothetical protein
MGKIYRDKKVVIVFVRFLRAPLQYGSKYTKKVGHGATLVGRTDDSVSSTMDQTDPGY